MSFLTSLVVKNKTKITTSFFYLQDRDYKLFAPRLNPKLCLRVTFPSSLGQWFARLVSSVGTFPLCIGTKAIAENFVSQPSDFLQVVPFELPALLSLRTLANLHQIHLVLHVLGHSECWPSHQGLTPHIARCFCTDADAGTASQTARPRRLEVLEP